MESFTVFTWGCNLPNIMKPTKLKLIGTTIITVINVILSMSNHIIIKFLNPRAG